MVTLNFCLNMDSNKCRICLECDSSLLNIFNTTDPVMISTKIMSLVKIDKCPFWAGFLSTDKNIARSNIHTVLQKNPQNSTKSLKLGESCCVNMTNIQDIFQIKPDDGLPALICTKCNKKLDDCINFIKICEKSDQDLRKLKNNNEEYSATVNIKNNVNNNCVVKLSPKLKNKMLKGTSSSEVINLTLNDFRNLCEENKKTKKQQCFTCGKIVSSRFRLKTHLATHLEEKPHSCTFCKKKFSIIENLNTHLRTHTGEKPFHCSICGQKFAQSSGLLVHKRKHTGQKPYKCSLCSRSFQTVGNLRYHVRAHTGERKYECDICNRAFITRSDLKQHIMTHSGEKPHVCSVCGMRFSRASNLKRHIRYLHNVGKSFMCEQCPTKFVRKSDLAKHSKRHKNKS